MAAIHPELISEFLKRISAISTVPEKELKLEGLINRLEDEMEKIDVFKNELPISILLINEVILNMKEELIRCKEQKFEPVLEEFIPLKKSCDVEKHSEVVKQNDNRDKMNWMSSVQLWNSSDQIKQIDEEEDRRAISSFKSLSVFPVQLKKKEDEDDAGLSLFTPGTVPNQVTENKSNCSRGVCSSSFDGESNQRSGLNQPQTSRKQRRCWSPELHRRFVNALQQLGGSQVATPKQIRELMQVDGLTNDEVKSHLQKYRLHTRRVPSAGSTATNQSHILLGGLFIGQDQFRESSKQSNSHSGSPQGPLNSTRAGPDSAEDDESEDGKSESYSWKK